MDLDPTQGQLSETKGQTADTAQEHRPGSLAVAGKLYVSQLGDAIRSSIGRYRHHLAVATGTVALAGVVAVAASAGGTNPAAAHTATPDLAARAAAADRGNRSAERSPSATPTGQPTSVTTPGQTSSTTTTAKNFAIKTPVAPLAGAAGKVPVKTAGTKPAPAKPAPAKKAAPAWVLPMAKSDLTSCYEYRTDPYPQFHKGIDFANVAGTKIRAVNAGTVIMAGDNGDGYGNKVVLNHGRNIFSLYGHASSVAVHVGQRVAAGQTLSYEGSTGDSTGPHLHFEIWKGMWNQVEPAKFLRGKGLKIGC